MVGATGTNDRAVSPTGGSSTPPTQAGTPPVRSESTIGARQPPRDVIPLAIAGQRRSSDRAASSPSRPSATQLARQSSVGQPRLERNPSRSNTSPVSVWTVPLVGSSLCYHLWAGIAAVWLHSGYNMATSYVCGWRDNLQYVHH